MKLLVAKSGVGSLMPSFVCQLSTTAKRVKYVGINYIGRVVLLNILNKGYPLIILFKHPFGLK
jgi:hypothetical protein